MNAISNAHIEATNLGFKLMFTRGKYTFHIWTTANGVPLSNERFLRRKATDSPIGTFATKLDARSFANQALIQRAAGMATGCL